VRFSYLLTLQVMQIIKGPRTHGSIARKKTIEVIKNYSELTAETTEKRANKKGCEMEANPPENCLRRPDRKKVLGKKNSEGGGKNILLLEVGKNKDSVSRKVAWHLQHARGLMEKKKTDEIERDRAQKKTSREKKNL